ncbi:MAG: hypothetical protein MZV64_09765 [Ignavibacteriales bacterium]|nr:hypothetical protein [Ignavibacteriales bacterium]
MKTSRARSRISFLRLSCSTTIDKTRSSCHLLYNKRISLIRPGRKNRPVLPAFGVVYFRHGAVYRDRRPPGPSPGMHGRLPPGL